MTVAGLSPVVVTVTQAIPALNLTVTPSNHDVTASAGTALFDVATASAWTAGSNQSWCTVTPSGTGNGTLSAVYLQNSSGAQRIASITVTVTGLPPVVVTVTQALNSPTLLVTPANQNVTETAGNTTFTVTSNSAWAATVNQSWCMVTPSGNGNGLITATYETNYTISPRVASITVTVPGIDPVTVTVTQAAGAATLIVTPDNRNVASDAGSTNFSVNSNSAWQAGSNASWCMITTSGNGSGTLLANYTTNPLATERIATLQVTVAGLSPVNVTVTQAGAPATLIVAPPLQTVAKSAGTTTFSVSSNASWLASSDVIWCSPTHSGSGNGTLTADYLENTGTALRTANILVTVPGALSQTVKVEQLPTTVSVPENPIALLSLYPNPTSGIFRISSESVISNLEVTLLDNSGKLLFVRHCSGETFYLFNLTGYPKGNYLVKVKTADKSMTWKLTLK